MYTRAAFAAAGALVLAAFLSTTSAYAQESETDKWQYEANVYLWGADIGGRTQTGEDVSISFNDLFDNLNFGAMGGLQASRGKFGLFIDAIYLDVDNTERSSIETPGPNIDVRSDIEMKAFITTFGGEYEIFNSGGTKINALGGLRYLRLDLDLDLEIGSRLNPSWDESYDAWDAVIGFRGRTDLNEKWYLTYYGDIGGGDSDETWQALAAVNYKFAKFDMVAGYRYAEWDLNDFGPFDELDLSGAFIGARFSF